MAFEDGYALLVLNPGAGPKPGVTEDGYALLVLNPGAGPKPGVTEDGYALNVVNADNAAAPPPGLLIALHPNVGVEQSEFEIIGIGLGTTQAQRVSVPHLSNGEMAVVSWDTIARTAAVGEQEIDGDEGTTNLEHQSVRVTVPLGATTGLVVIEADDGS